MWTLILIALGSDIPKYNFMTFDNKQECLESVANYYVINDVWYEVSEVCV